MQNIAINSTESQEQNTDFGTIDLENSVPTEEEFFDMIEAQARQLARITITNTIKAEFERFVGAARYKRSGERKEQRNGIRYRDFETRFGLIEDIPIPRTRHQQFRSTLFTRWKRREHKITHAIADMFINGVSTRKVKNITKTIWGNQYSASTVSRSNKVLQQEYLQWMNRSITSPICYLFLDAVNLKVRRHWVSHEALLCAVGITKDGKKEFLGFLLGGKESTRSWEQLLMHLINRGLSAKELKLITVDGNPGLLSALDSLLPDTPLQRCIVHKIRNVVGRCPRSLRGVVPADAKRIFYATSESEARELFKEFKQRWNTQIPKVVECIEKDLDQILAFYSFPYKHWIKIRSTNVIERSFKEFRRRIKVMETFPNELSCLRILFSLAKMLNENWEYKPIKDF
jgi:transposase-like protein